MARKSIHNYIFTPGAGGAGTVTIPDPFKLSDILMVTNVTRNTVIYNFGDPSRGGTVAFTNAPSVSLTSAAGTSLSDGKAVFTNLNNGYTTLTLTFDTSSHNAADELMIYVESSELKVRPYDFGIDAVERMKVAAPQSLIDADFEYGMQPTKWVSFATMNDMPTVYEVPGSDLSLGANIGSYATFLSGGVGTAGNPGHWIGSPAQTQILPQNQGYEPATGGASMAGPRAILNGYYMIIAQGQAGQPNCAAGTTSITHELPIVPAYGGIYQRSFTVQSTAGWREGDVMCVVEMPGEGTSSSTTIPTAVGLTGNSVVATAAAVRAAGDTALTANNTAISANAIIMVETTQFGVWEAMAVTGGGGTASLTVLRNLWGTNAANATIPAGARIRQLSGNVGAAPAGAFFSNANVEIMRVDSVDSRNQFTVTRSWFNVNASPTFGANSIVFKVNHSANIAASQIDDANIEIVRATTVSAGHIATNPFTVIERGRLGTKPLSAAGPGSLYISLTGAFFAGNTSAPSVMMYIPQHNIGLFSNSNLGNCFVSTLNFSQAVTVSNIEGVFINQINDRDYVKYYPKVTVNQLPGYQLNTNDASTTIRRGGIYTGANLQVANVTSNVGSPSLITINTVYQHGLTPGQAIQVQLQHGVQSTGQFANVFEGGSGQFVINSTPTPKSFTYIGKPNLIVPAMHTVGSIGSGGQLTANVIMFPTGLVKHRPFDGGNNIGTNTPAHGYEMTRQTKKYFRYQSGKGTMFTSGTQFCPTFQLANLEASGTTVGSTVTVTTENEHGLQIGANVTMYGVNTTGYNGFYRVATVTNNNEFTFLSTQELGSTQPVWTRTKISTTEYAGMSYPRVTITNWHGSKVRSGIFDDQNGVFYEYDGQQFFAVKRSSAIDLAGRAAIGANSNYVIGNQDTRFVDQVATGDQIVIKGMTHTVTDVVDQNHMYIQPVYRGQFNAQDARICRVSEERTPQKAFNYDRADGTGPSGYVMDLRKMQMIGIQYTWYGAGFVDYMMRAIDGKMIILHRSKGNNVNDEAYMRTGNLPARYQAVNKGPKTWTSKAVNATATEIQLYDVSEFPAANATYPVHVQIDNELISYTGVFTANGNITGLTRGATLSNYVFNETRSLWKNSNAGTTWASRGMPANVTWSSQAFNARTGTWVAVAGYGSASDRSVYSKDGHIWQAGGSLPSTSTWVSVAFGKLNGIDTFVAVSNTNGTASAYSQDDGVSWTPLTLSATAQWSSVSYGFDQNNTPVFVAIAGLGSSSTSTAYLKVIGTGWVAGGALPTSQNWSALAFGKTNANVAPGGSAVSARGNYFYAVGGGANMQTASVISAYTTDGGVTWFQGALPAITASTAYSAIAFGNNTWIAVAGGYGGTADALLGAFIHGNPAVATWTTMATPAGRWRSIAWGPIYGMSQSSTPNVGQAGQWMMVSEASGTTVAYMTNPHLIAPGTTPLWLAGGTLGSTALPTTATWSSVCWGKGMFTALSSNQWQVAISTYGNAWATSELTVAANWQSVAAGAGNLVVPQFGSTGTQVSYNGGRTWVAGGALPSSSNWIDVAYAPHMGRGNQGRFVAISNTSGTVNAYQDADNLGTTWIAGGALPATATWTSIAYTNGAFVAVAAGTQTSAFSANAGITWTGVNLPSSSNWQSVAAGLVPSLAATTGNVYAVVAVSSTSGTIGAYSNVVIGTSGQSALSLWGSATLPVTASWQAVGYGYNIYDNTARFIAISGTADNKTAISTNGGASWTQGGNLPSSSNWYKVAYGANGIWVAIANDRNTFAAYSVDEGVTWTGASLPTACNWTDVIYHPQHHHFVAISGDATNASANVSIARPTAGIGQSHTANAGVKVVSVSASPDLNHWGSAIIMDGGFTVDRTYTFTYNVTNFQVQGTAGIPQTMFMMRLAPTISNSMTGELGGKDLINRAQVLLQSMYINVGSAAARFLVQGILNPTNLINANWRPLNAPATFLQPSFSQFVANSLATNPGGIRQIIFDANTTATGVQVGQGAGSHAATGGEQLFSIPVTQTNSGFLDLSQIKEITSMVLPGQGTYPNGNEVLAINIVPITAVSSNVDIQLTFIESQA